MRASAPSYPSAQNLWTRWEDFLRGIETRPWLLVLLMLLVYVSYVSRPLLRPLWFDELLTFYMSSAPSASRLFELIQHPQNIDLQPPLGYLATRVSFHFFGHSALAARLPSVTAYFLATVCCFLFFKRSLGAWYGALAAVSFWYCNSLQYAAEARPYALLLFFFCAAMLCWQTAISADRDRPSARFLLP